MTWQAIVESIGARIESDDRLYMLDEVEDMTQAEHASVLLHERIRGSRGRIVTCSLGGNEVIGTLVDSGVDWFTLRHIGELQVIASAKVTAISGLSVASVASSRYVPTFNSVLRHLIGQRIQINRLTEPISGSLKPWEMIISSSKLCEK